MQRRNRPARRKSRMLPWLGGLAALIVLGAVILTLMAPTLVTRFIRSYLLREEFRQKAEEMISNITGGEARIASLTWNDDNAIVSELQLENAHGWDVDATGLHASLDFGAIRTGSWSVHSAGADEFTLRRSPVQPTRNPATAVSAQIDSPDASDSIPSFLRKHIPSKVEISGFDVHRFFFEQGGWKIDSASLQVGDWSSGKTAVPLKLSGGTLQTPIKTAALQEPLKLNISKAALRVTDDQIYLSDAALSWVSPATATLRGSLKFESGTWQIFAHAQAVPVAEFLDAWWKQRLSGSVKGDLEMLGSRGSPPTWKADAVLENGVLQGLPILEHLATYTKVERFKRIVLDICQASFLPQSNAALRIERIIVQSNGLLRIEGAMTVQGRVIEGDFMLGVTPETLRWIPGADSRVFIEKNATGPTGLLWTHVHIAGTLDTPQEDLSSRLIGSAGMSLLLDTPGKVINQGAETLLKPVLGEDAAKVPGKIIDGAGGVIENGVKAGAGILNKVLPVFPGK